MEYTGRRKERPIAVITQPEYTPTYSQGVVTSAPAKGSVEKNKEPRDRILDWYRLVVRLIQAITKALFEPQQTLREFAKESSKLLGPAARYFIELTEMAERTLYSRYRPTAEDAEKSEELSHDVEEGIKGEGI